ncbi:MAG: PaaI family thioesterase, partial [Alphaproteobacteria bacterium]|nr:PaaI family thioesterase [Alphaproteobacteria bacterium]
MSKPLTTPDERLALFQKWFCDAIPHNKALGLKVLSAARGSASMQLEWREELVGNPETGVLAGGPLTAMLDSCCGMSVATMLKNPMPFATLDLRIDYARPATPGKPVI